jgi:hypothetical protein
LTCFAICYGAFDKDKPAATTSLRNSNPEILANWSALESSIDNEHAFSTGGTQDGDHTQGSARCFSQASAPATRVDGNNFESADLGSLWVDTDDNALYILTATVPTWTSTSDSIIETLLASSRIFLDTLGVTGDFDVNTDKFNVDAATGNTTAAGTLEATGLTTVADGSLTKTSAAPTTDAMIANKKYVDDSGLTLAVSQGNATGQSTSTLLDWKTEKTVDFTAVSGRKVLITCVMGIRLADGSADFRITIDGSPITNWSLGGEVSTTIDSSTSFSWVDTATGSSRTYDLDFTAGQSGRTVTSIDKSMITVTEFLTP